VSFQVLYKTAPHMQGCYSAAFERREDRDAFTRHEQVWWYHLGEDEDWGWHRGGAWAGAEHLADATGVSDDEFRPMAGVDLSDWNSPEDAAYDEEEGPENDERW
jgi:hypothetical protein